MSAPNNKPTSNSVSSNTPPPHCQLFSIIKLLTNAQTYASKTLAAAQVWNEEGDKATMAKELPLLRWQLNNDMTKVIDALNAVKAQISKEIATHKRKYSSLSSENAKLIKLNRELEMMEETLAEAVSAKADVPSKQNSAPDSSPVDPTKSDVQTSKSEINDATATPSTSK